MPYSTTNQVVIYDFTRFFFDWETPCQEAEIDKMIKDGKYFKAALSTAQSDIVFTLDNNQVSVKASGDILPNQSFSVYYCEAGSYTNGAGTCATEVQSNPVSLAADCTALYPTAASSVATGAYSVTTVAGKTVNTKAIVADVGTLFNTCNGAQPTSLSTATAPLTCTFTTASNFLTFASGIVSATTNRINPWDQDQTFTVTCSQKGATAKYTSNIVSVSYTGCGTQTPVATSAAVAVTGTVGQQDNFYAS